MFKDKHLLIGRDAQAMSVLRYPFNRNVWAKLSFILSFQGRAYMSNSVG